MEKVYIQGVKIYLWRERKVMGVDEVEWIFIKDIFPELKEKYKGYTIKRLFGYGSYKI